MVRLRGFPTNEHAADTVWTSHISSGSTLSPASEIYDSESRFARCHLAAGSGNLILGTLRHLEGLSVPVEEYNLKKTLLEYMSLEKVKNQE